MTTDQLAPIPPLLPPASVQQPPSSQLAGLDSGTQENIVSRRDRFMMAKAYPRDEEKCLSKILMSCRRVSVAATAEYNIKNRGSGPSIRLMEEIARYWDNFESGSRMIELGEIGTCSRVEVFALDLETLGYRSEEIIVEHKLLEKGGGLKICKTPDDVYLAVAQRAGRRIRECMKKIIPSWVTDLALEECRKTVASDAGIAEVKRKVVEGFSRINVTESMIAAYLRKPVKDIHADEIEELRGIFTAIQSGEAQISDVFTGGAEPPQAETTKKTRSGGKSTKKGEDSGATAAYQSADASVTVSEKKQNEADAQQSSAPAAETNTSTTNPTPEIVDVVDTSEVQTDAPAEEVGAEETQEDGDIF